MRTEKQKQTSRANGSKSNGPTSEAGKSKSARNATTHGFSATTGQITLLQNESKEVFEAYSQAFFARFQPIDLVEADLVQQMISATWRLRRMDAAEIAILDLEIEDQRDRIDNIFEEIDEVSRTGLAVRRLAERSNSLDLLTRYRTQARRTFTTALKTLQLLQGNRFNRQPIEPGQPPVCTPSVETNPECSFERENQAEEQSPQVCRQNSEFPNEPEGRHNTVSFRVAGHAFARYDANFTHYITDKPVEDNHDIVYVSLNN